MQNLLSMFLVVTLIWGCATPRMDKNNTNLMRLEMGMTRQQVLSIMGKPLFHEAYANLNNKEIVTSFPKKG